MDLDFHSVVYFLDSLEGEKYINLQGGLSSYSKAKEFICL